MLPGVDVTTPGALPSFERGDLLSVSVPGNPAPLAVGFATMSSVQAAERVTGGAGQGKLIEVAQVGGWVHGAGGWGWCVCGCQAPKERGQHGERQADRGGACVWGPVRSSWQW